MSFEEPNEFYFVFLAGFPVNYGAVFAGVDGSNWAAQSSWICSWICHKLGEDLYALKDSAFLRHSFFL